MKFLVSVAHVLLAANVAVASPLMEGAKAELSRRNAIRRSNRFQGKGITSIVNGTAAEESSNWSGAALTGTGFTEVQGTFTVPQPSPPAGGSTRTEFCGAAWVGIDGFSDADLIQTGVLWCVENGAFEYEAWYEYLPASLIAYTGITVTAGSVVTVTATKTSTNGGTTTLTAGGKTVTHTFSGQSSPLPGTSAEWIVEDFESGNSLVPFADFGTVTFTGATAIKSGATVTASSTGSTNIFIGTSSGETLTSTTISGSTVTVKYV